MKKQKPNKKKQQNQQGFTLIELLAVITIMGILMMVAIPSVSRTIENSRRDTFANTATAYIDAVKNSISADEVECSTKSSTTMDTPISSVVAGTYYVNVATDDSDSAAAGIKANNATDNAKALMESGGKSSWGSAHVRGYVEIKKSIVDTKTTYSYRITLVDSGNHGTKGGEEITTGKNNGLVGTKNVVKRSDINAVASLVYNESTATNINKAPVKAEGAVSEVLVCKIAA